MFFFQKETFVVTVEGINFSKMVNVLLKKIVHLYPELQIHK